MSGKSTRLSVKCLHFWPPVQSLPDASCILSSNARFLKSVNLLTVPRLYISLLQYFDSLFILTGGQHLLSLQWMHVS